MATRTPRHNLVFNLVKLDNQTNPRQEHNLVKLVLPAQILNISSVPNITIEYLGIRVKMRADNNRQHPLSALNCYSLSAHANEDAVNKKINIHICG
jgi:hypothetical protein